MIIPTSERSIAYIFAQQFTLNEHIKFHAKSS